MNQKKIGEFIASLRKEKNLTQVELAEKLGISNKAVSKWETGRCLPDASLYSSLCGILRITVNDLLNGELINSENKEAMTDKNLLSVIKLYENIKSKRNIFIGLFIVTIGQLIGIYHFEEPINNFQQFFSGVSLGLSLGITIIGIIWIVYGAVKFAKTKSI